ncbi:MAG: 2-phosphosulfolactate phosphatase [Bacteroidetes bacterium]|nr:2-phosphosulfolactate phosphatase [Bacteroidota bacterium]
MIKVQVVLSPALLHLFDSKNKNVVVIDILRATSTICTAIAHGALSVKPVNNTDDALILKGSGYLSAAERDGHKLEGFDMGNSPFECMNGAVLGKKIALTTTNGTKCITAATIAGAANVLSGSFLNITALANFLKADSRDVILFCAGWRDRVNLEDSLFAGALVNRLVSKDELDCDSALMVMDLYHRAKSNLGLYLEQSSHYKRLSRLHHQEDMEYCLQSDVIDIVVGLKKGEMVNMA